MKIRLRVSSIGLLAGVLILLGAQNNRALAVGDEAAGPQMGIPIHYKADKPGFVTLVMDDKDGKRLENLAFDHPVQAGDNVIYWDGSSLAGVATPGTYE